MRRLLGKEEGTVSCAAPASLASPSTLQLNLRCTVVHSDIPIPPSPVGLDVRGSGARSYMSMRLCDPYSALHTDMTSPLPKRD